MLVSQSTIAQLEAFNKYAKFISDQFGVTVVLDGTKACTNGKTIYLPSLSAMNQEEIEFLYCVLLHEVGHVRHTPFSPELFQGIKTQDHFHICNALEDARIENKLMAEFDGAHQIFHDLYNKFTADDNFMNRVFRVKHAHMSTWEAISAYCHNYFINLDTKQAMSEFVPPKALKELQKFVTDNKIDALLAKTDLDSWDDVFKLGTKIYDLYFSSKTDHSQKVSITPLVKTMEKVQNEHLSEMDKLAQELAQKIEEMQGRMKPLQDKIRARRESNKDKISKLYEDQEKLEKIIDELSTVQDNRHTLDSKNERIQKMEESIKEMTDRLNEYEKKKLDLQNEINEQIKKELEKINKKQQQTVDSPLEPFASEEEPSQKSVAPQKTELSESEMSSKLQSMKEKLARLEERMKNLGDKIKEKTPKMEANKNITQEALKELASVNNPELLNLPTDQLDKMVSKESQKYNQVRDQLRNLTDTGAEGEQLQRLRNELNAAKEQMAQEMVERLQEMQEQFDKAGIPIQVVPQFEPNPAWEESDVAQQAFDQQASEDSGDLVSNGCGFGLNSPRDIITYIDKTKKDVVSFDIGQHFYESNHESKLESFNEETSQVTNTKTVEDGKVSKSTRKHVPLSTQFDKVTTKTHSDGKKVHEIKTRLSTNVAQVKNLFRKHLKFDKKDQFHGNQEEGKLDSRNLWKLATKTDDLYYEVNRPKFVNKVSAAIAIDVSGSMDKDFTEHGEKLQELTLLLSEGLKEVHIQHEIVGFHAPVNHELRALGASPVYNRNSNNLETVVYKNFVDRHNHGLQNIEIQCSDNSDGESLKVIGQRLLKSRSKRKVMFVITDGKPFLSDADVNVLDQDLKNTIQWCRQNKIELFAFGFNEQGREFYGERFCFVKTYQDLLTFIKEKL